MKNQKITIATRPFDLVYITIIKFMALKESRPIPSWPQPTAHTPLIF